MADSYTTNLNSGVPSTIPTDALNTNYNFQFPQSNGNDLTGYYNNFKGIQDLLDKYFTSDLESQRANKISELESSLNQYGTKATRTQAIGEQFGIPKDIEALKALNLQIAERLGQAGIEQQQQTGIGNTQATAGAYSENARRKALAEVGALQARQAALQGNIELSQKLVQQAVDVEFAPVEAKINSIQQFLKLNEDQLSRADKKKADALKIILDQQQTQIDAQKQEKRDVLSLSNKYLDAGITANDTVATAQQKALNSRSYQTEQQRATNLALGTSQNQDRLLTPSEQQLYGVPAGTTFNQVLGTIPISQTSREKLSNLTQAVPILNNLETLSKGLNLGSSAGSAFFKGLGLSVSSLAPSSQAAQYNAIKESFLGKISRAAGESGVLTDQDIARIRKAIPGFYDTQTSKTQKFTNLRNILNDIQAKARLGLTGNVLQSPSLNNNPLGLDL